MATNEKFYECRSRVDIVEELRAKKKFYKYVIGFSIASAMAIAMGVLNCDETGICTMVAFLATWAILRKTN